MVCYHVCTIMYKVQFYILTLYKRALFGQICLCSSNNPASLCKLFVMVREIHMFDVARDLRLWLIITEADYSEQLQGNLEIEEMVVDNEA